MQENRIGRFNKRPLLLGALSLLAWASVNSAIPFNEDLTAETLIAKHLDSILKSDAALVATHLQTIRSKQPLMGTTKKRTLAGVVYTHAGLARAALGEEFPDLWPEYQEDKATEDDWWDEEVELAEDE